MNVTNVLNSAPHQNFIERWLKPERGWMKLNVDVAVDIEGQRIEFGWILRSDNGDFVASIYVPWKGVATQPKEWVVCSCNKKNECKNENQENQNAQIKERA